MLTMLKSVYNGLRGPLFRMRGYKMLGREETIAFMKPHCIQSLPGTTLSLPQVHNAGNPDTKIFHEKRITTDEVYVWRYRHDKQDVKLSRYGSVVIGGRVLCTDWSIHSFYKDIWKPDTRVRKRVPAFVALFSQHQDGILYGGYYDYMFKVATKLSRIKDAMPREEFSKLLISYPLFKTDYEWEFLALLGVDMAQVIDSREYQLTSREVITGNSSHWYPNIDEILSLKNHILKNVRLADNTGTRIYISRACRRNIVNEEELIILLKKFDFTIIEDKPRSIAEQISIYANASFIIGPHGASFSNVIWCRPGTHLMELFSPNYAPDFFLYLAAIMGMTYSAYYEGIPDPNVDYRAGLVEDVYVSVAKLEEHLRKIL